MARVIFLTQVLPYPLDAGPKVRAYHMIRRVAQRHALTLVSFVRPDDEPESITHLAEICRAVYTVPIRRSAWRNVRAAVKGFATGLPMVIARDEMAEMSALLRRLAEEEPFDLVHADQLSMAGWGMQAARNTAARGGTVSPALLDEHNAIHVLAQRMAEIESQPARRALMRREARAFAAYESAMCRAYDAILTVTREDRERLLALVSDNGRTQTGESPQAGKFHYLPICVDPAEVRPVARAAGGPPTILHLGTMFWPPNVSGVLWFAEQVLPLVHQSVPDARFVIAGKNPPEPVRRLAADPRVEVTGYVPDPAPYLARSDVFVVPLHAGGGMRVKILDAWLWGMPIVATPVGAEGIEVRSGENILIGADAREFADATVRLLTDPALNIRLRTAGRSWVERTYAWQAVYEKIDAVYDGLLDPSKGMHSTND